MDLDSEPVLLLGGRQWFPGKYLTTSSSKIVYIHVYIWASLVAQPVKNQPAMWKTWVRSLVWEDPLEKGKATHSSILA